MSLDQRRSVGSLMNHITFLDQRSLIGAPYESRNVFGPKEVGWGPRELYNVFGLKEVSLGPVLVTSQSELGAVGAKRDVENNPKCIPLTVSLPHDPTRTCRP